MLISGTQGCRFKSALKTFAKHKPEAKCVCTMGNVGSRVVGTSAAPLITNLRKRNVFSPVLGETALNQPRLSFTL